MADYKIRISDSTAKTNKISFTIPANTGKSYKVKIESPAGSYGTWYYNSASTAKTYTRSINVVYLSKIRVTVSESQGTNAQEKIYTPWCGQLTETQKIVDPALTKLERYETIGLSVPVLLGYAAGKLSCKKTEGAMNTVSYILTFSAAALALISLEFNVPKSVPPIAEVSTYYNTTSSTIYISITIKHENGTTETKSTQKAIPGF